MKRLWIVLIAGLLWTAPMYAQLDFGLKAGLNLAGKPSDLNEDNVGNKSNYTGFFVGAMAKFTLPIIGLGVEGDVLYSNSGTELGGKTAKKHSIEIPIYLRYDLSLPLVSKVVIPFVAIGPQFGFNISSDDLDIKDTDKYSFKKSTASLNLGLGALFVSHLQLHLNYNIPLGNTAELKPIDTAKEVIDSKTKTWQVSLAYIF